MSFEGARPGAAWSSSARVVRCSVQSGNERNPCEVLYMSLQTALSTARKRGSNKAQDSKTQVFLGDWNLYLVSSVRLRMVEREEGGDDVRSAWPFDTLGDTRATMAGIKGRQIARWSQSQKAGLSSDWSLQLDSMKLESLVIVNQPCHGECVLGSCTHRPSHQESR